MTICSKFSISKEKLNELYVNQFLSQKEVAKKIGCSRENIEYYIIKYKIPCRSRKEAITRIKQKPITKVCDHCKNIFQGADNQKYCSECRHWTMHKSQNKYYHSHKTLIAEKNRIFQKTLAYWKYQAYLALGNKCQRCGMTNKEHLKKYNCNLEIHHKDHNRNNCKKSNLETLCKKCNIRDNHK